MKKRDEKHTFMKSFFRESVVEETKLEAACRLIPSTRNPCKASLATMFGVKQSEIRHFLIRGAGLGRHQI